MIGCRIGKVKFKSGPIVSVLNTPKRTKTAFNNSCDRIESVMGGSLKGHLVVGWDKTGAYSIMFDTTGADIPSALLGSWVKDIILREICSLDTQQSINDRLE